MPGFLHDKYGLDLTHLGPPLIVIYVVADIGSIGGGWLSTGFVARGMESGCGAQDGDADLRDRGCTPVQCIMFTGGNLWLTVGLISLAAAAHQGWSANLFTIPSDTFPRAGGGLGGGTGRHGRSDRRNAGGAGDRDSGWTIRSKSYGPLFVVAGSMYLLALFVIHKLLPRLEQTAV